MLIHIGYHKTATTWLQSSVFNRHELGFASPWGRDLILADWVAPDPLTFCPAEIQSAYQPNIQCARAKGLVPVLTHERLSGYPASGGYDSAVIANRLAASFPDARILIVIREQKSLIRSWYAQYVRDGGGLSISQYLSSPQPHLVRMPSFRFEFYEFDRLIRHYMRLYQASNVLVLPYEMLLQSASTFIGSITEFMDMPAPFQLHGGSKNRGTTPAWISVARIGNRLFSKNQLNTGCVADSAVLHKATRKAASVVDRRTPRTIQKHVDERMQRCIRDRVGERYKESNRRTADLIGIDLGALGYDT